MTIAQSLQQFYTQNNLPEKGGVEEDTFKIGFKFFTLTLPNSQIRKDIIHVHDIQHVLYNCDTTWKGEAFIAGWEIATKLWKKAPIISLLSFWVFGFCLFIYPKEVLKGYKAGLGNKGIIDLKMNKKALFALTPSELKLLIKKEKDMNFNWFIYMFWCIISEFIFLFPLLFLITFLFYFL